jgi:hypothetical protein
LSCLTYRGVVSRSEAQWVRVFLQSWILSLVTRLFLRWTDPFSSEIAKVQGWNTKRWGTTHGRKVQILDCDGRLRLVYSMSEQFSCAFACSPQRDDGNMPWSGLLALWLGPGIK